MIRGKNIYPINTAKILSKIVILWLFFFFINKGTEINKDIKRV